MRLQRLIAITVVLGAVLSSPPSAAAQEETPAAPTLATAADTALEQRVIEVGGGLRCPVCQGLSIVDSPSPLAQDMKRLVREQLAAGATPDAVRSYFVERYGEWVLLKPTARGANLTVWLLPLAALLGGGLLIWIAVRRWVHQAAEQPAGAAVVGTPAELGARREALGRGLAELATDFAEGKIGQRDYDALRQRDEAEVAALSTALQETKKARRDRTPTERPAPKTRRMHPAVGWAIGAGAFGVLAVFSLKGAVGARQPGGTITGIDLSSPQGGGEGGAGAGAGESDISLGAADSARLVRLETRVARDSTDHAALLELGHLYLRQQRLQRAATVSMKAVQLRPESRETAEAFAHLGMILWNAGETDVGLQALEKALFLHQDLPEALLYKGIVLFAGSQDPRGAAAAWERYLEVAPPDAETGRVRSMLEAARQSIQ